MNGSSKYEDAVSRCQELEVNVRLWMAANDARPSGSGSSSIYAPGSSSASPAWAAETAAAASTPVWSGCATPADPCLPKVQPVLAGAMNP